LTLSPFDDGNLIQESNLELIDFDEIGTIVSSKMSSHNITFSKQNHFSTKEEYEENVRKAQQYIINEEIEKVVLSKVKSLGQSIDPVGSFFNLEENYKRAFIYCLYHPHAGTWIGASPEKLLEKKGLNGYHIHSIAGTKSLDQEWTSKEVKEQNVVTDFVISQLHSHGIRKGEVEGPFDLAYGNIKHLKTSISFKSSIESSEILNYIHPTPAVCGIPVNKAKRIIQELEGYNRSFYTGYLGLQSQKAQLESFFVNLRCMQVTDDNCYIYTGAGIMKDSVPGDEWNEVEAKAKTLIDCLIINE